MNKRLAAPAQSTNTLEHADLGNNVREEREYGLSDLNWEDTGDEVTDPSMKGFNSGYQHDPYQFQQWASRNVLHTVKKGETLAKIASNNKTSWQELAKLNKEYFAKNSNKLKAGHVIVVSRQSISDEMKMSKTASDFLVTEYSYLPEDMAREMLTIWNGADGQLQDFYNGFVMNRFTNEMRAGIAECLRKWGYEVTPVYEDRTPHYAKKKTLEDYKTMYLEYVKVAEKAVKNDDAEKILDYFKEVFPDSYAAQLVSDAVKQTRQAAKRKVTLAEAGGLADYYKAIYPDDYANALIDISLDKGPFMGFQEFLDLQLTDQDMEQIDKVDSENSDPWSDTVRGPGGAEYGIGGNSFGYDPVSDLRSDTGFPASTYETTAMIDRRGLKKNK